MNKKKSILKTIFAKYKSHLLPNNNRRFQTDYYRTHPNFKVCACRKGPAKRFKNLPYFIYTKIQSWFFHFSFRATFFPLKNVLANVDIDQGIYWGKNKVARNEKWKKQLWIFVYIKYGKESWRLRNWPIRMYLSSNNNACTLKVRLPANFLTSKILLKIFFKFFFLFSFKISFKSVKQKILKHSVSFIVELSVALSVEFNMTLNSTNLDTLVPIRHLLKKKCIDRDLPSKT